MSDLTDDPNDPRLGHGSNDAPVPQNEAYLVLSEAERKAGFVRPVRTKYVHVGPAGPVAENLRELTDEEKATFEGVGYVHFESYPDDEDRIGRYWTAEQLASVGKGCGTVTSMSQAIAETYARDPFFYGSTYCVGCGMHKPVGRTGEFVWDGPYDPVTGEYTTDRVGT